MKRILILVLCSAFSYESLRGEVTVVFNPYKEAVLSSKVSSFVTSVEKEMGENFLSGELLMTLESAEFKAKLERACALVEKQKAIVEANYCLYSEKIISEAELKSSIAELVSFQADLVAAQLNLKSCYVTAPFDGSVVEVFVKPFERTIEETSLIEIIGSEKLVAKFYFPNEDADQLDIGQRVKIKIQNRDKEVSAYITNISPVIDPANNFTKVFAEFDNRDHELKPGVVGILHSIQSPHPSFSDVIVRQSSLIPENLISNHLEFLIIRGDLEGIKKKAIILNFFSWDWWMVWKKTFHFPLQFDIKKFSLSDLYLRGEVV